VAAGWISKEIRLSRHTLLEVVEVGNSRLRLAAGWISDPIANLRKREGPGEIPGLLLVPSVAAAKERRRPGNARAYVAFGDTPVRDKAC
jgi:hypothetical protein